MTYSLFLGRGDVELKEDDVAVEDDVRLAFLAVLPLVLALLLGPQLLERVEAHNLGADEPAFEVGVNSARCLGRLEPLANAPAFDFVGARGEEVNEVNGAERRLYDLRQHCGHLLVFLELHFAVIWSVLELALEPAGEGDDLSASVPLHPLVNLDQPLVLLACVVLRRQVDEVDDRFRGEQHVGVEVVHVNGAPLVHAVANLLALVGWRVHDKNNSGRGRSRVQGSGFRVQGAGFRVQGSGFRVQGSGLRVQGFKVQGSGFGLQSVKCRVLCRANVGGVKGSELCLGFFLGSRFRVKGVEFRVTGLGFWVLGL